jgi:hypothetical protein
LLPQWQQQTMLLLLAQRVLFLLRLGQPAADSAAAKAQQQMLGSTPVHLAGAEKLVPYNRHATFYARHNP